MFSVSLYREKKKRRGGGAWGKTMEEKGGGWRKAWQIHSLRKKDRKKRKGGSGLHKGQSIMGTEEKKERKRTRF